MLTALYAAANLIYATTPWDHLYHYPHFTDEKVRFRHVRYLDSCRHWLIPEPACFLLARDPTCQQGQVVYDFSWFIAE